jgi:hypothetical protein
VAPKEPNDQHSCLLLQRCYHPIVVPLDVEHSASAPENAGPRVRGLDLLGAAPLRPVGDCQPDIILRPGRPNSFVAGMDAWLRLARLATSPDEFVYAEPAMFLPPVRSVVPGDPQHQVNNLGQAYENAPQSLREIEGTTTFKT